MTFPDQYHAVYFCWICLQCSVLYKQIAVYSGLSLKPEKGVTDVNLHFFFFILPPAGKDIAELMLDFIEWLTNQDFGRRCILSVRDILSWVNFLNQVCERDADGFMTMGEDEEQDEVEWDLRLNTVTAFIHAACLVYVDGIGSGGSREGSNKELIKRAHLISLYFYYLYLNASGNSVI